MPHCGTPDTSNNESDQIAEFFGWLWFDEEGEQE